MENKKIDIKGLSTFAKLVLIGVLSAFYFSRVSAQVSNYVPLHNSPKFESLVERILIEAQIPIVKRPIPVATVREAIRKVRDSNPALAKSVAKYISTYDEKAGYSARLEIAASNDVDGTLPNTLPNARGELYTSSYHVSAEGFVNPSSWFLLNAGILAYDEGLDEKTAFAENTFIALGGKYLQADVGYRPHWLGPFQDSAMLFSTQAPAMFGVTISNSEQLSQFGIHYEMFWGELSETDEIRSQDRDERLTGKPKVLGMHMSINPLKHFTLGVNRVLQYGGANRSENPDDVWQALVTPEKYDNLKTGREEDSDFGNQLSSVTTRYILSERFPMSIYMEYAGEDTTAAAQYGLGNTSLMFGMHFPVVFASFDVTYEYADWQNAWYVNGNYGDGFTNYGAVMGHWGGQNRVFGDAVGAKTHFLKVNWFGDNQQFVSVGFRQIENAGYAGTDYSTGRELSLLYERNLGQYVIGLNGQLGTNVSDKSFGRLGGFIRW